MEKKDSSTEGEGESSTVSPDVQAFFDFVDREGRRRRRLELLNKKKKETSSGKQPANNVVPWQPKFEMEDFEMSSERIQFSSAKPCYEGDDGCSGRGIKRKSELAPPPSILKKYASRRFEFDLNKTNDSF
ncbi:hypothetical protein BHE74_00056276 [Ensete ventricosum]|nr:hypothetical protein B296_00054475 [Ensete ventricosum]RWW22179.1 hypothetical protein GW17_00013642 [Ensete ventricosum]RWW38489.1 hypothetical protein BHE74_00056276 [Ensete ventricosum]RZS26210.1 hypothetical protein BHM03_00059514 [Ensete ventricosum]